MGFEVVFDKTGYPYLKKVFKRRNPSERGVWVEIGKASNRNIDYLVTANRQMGYLVMQDEDGFVRALILTD